MYKHSLKPGVERLEDRLTPTSGIKATFTDGILDIGGTEKSDRIRVQQKQDRIEVDGIRIQVGNKSESSVAASKIRLIRIDGRGGDDVISLAPVANGQRITINQEVYGSAGKDTITGGDGVADIYGGDGDDTIQAGNGTTFMYGGAGNDTLRGGKGYNAFTGNEGNDSFIGGSNFDTLFETGDVNFFLNDYSMQGLGYDVFSSIETANLTGGDSVNFLNAKDFTGTAFLNGMGGGDTLWGGWGNDYLSGGDGNDYLYGFRGKDNLAGDDGNDDLYGGEHDDSLSGGSGNDYLKGEQGADALYGGPDQDQLFGGADNDFLDGGTGNDRLFGEEGNDTLQGGVGADALIGGTGADKLYGGSDLYCDRFYYQPGDQLFEINGQTTDALFFLTDGSTRTWSDKNVEKLDIALEEFQRLNNGAVRYFRTPQGSPLAFQRVGSLTGNLKGDNLGKGTIRLTDAFFTATDAQQQLVLKNLLFKGF